MPITEWSGTQIIGFNPGGVGMSQPPRFWGGVVGVHNIQEYEMRTFSKSGNFSKIEEVAYN